MVGELIKARIAPCDRDGRADLSRAFFVPFNPNHITIEENVGHFAQAAPGPSTPGKTPHVPSSPQNAVPAQRDGVSLATTLFFNTWNGEQLYTDVRRQTGQFSLFYNRAGAPEQHLLFSWGSIQIHGVLTSLRVRYTMFAPSGTPVRASADLSMQGQYFGEPPLVLEKRASAVYAGKLSLVSLADPSSWKEAASRAGVVHPRAELLGPGGTG